MTRLFSLRPFRPVLVVLARPPTQEALQKEALEADVISHNAIISSCERSNQWTPGSFEKIHWEKLPGLPGFGGKV